MLAPIVVEGGGTFDNKRETNGSRVKCDVGSGQHGSTTDENGRQRDNNSVKKKQDGRTEEEEEEESEEEKKPWLHL